jgi:hypothetical protein
MEMDYLLIVFDQLDVVSCEELLTPFAHAHLTERPPMLKRVAPLKE